MHRNKKNEPKKKKSDFHPLYDSYLEKWKEEQDQLKQQLIEEDVENLMWTEKEGAEGFAKCDSNLDGLPQRPLRLVAGVDVSFVKGSEENACASLVVLNFPDLQVVYEAHKRLTMPLPYISGFLAFREVPVLLELVQELRDRSPEMEPNVVFVDGSGILHPRGFGLASHFGILANLRTIGVAKTFLNVDGITKKNVQERLQLHRDGGNNDELLLEGNSGKIWGAALCPTEKVKNPVYISVGHQEVKRQV